jgi:hypothetical protein
MYRWGYQHAKSGKWTEGVDRLDDLSSNVWHGLVDKCDNIDEAFVHMGVPDPDRLYERFMASQSEEETEDLYEQFMNVCADWSWTYEGTLAMLKYDQQAAYMEKVEGPEL